MIDCTFLMPPEEDGTQCRAKIIALIDSHLVENKLEKHSEHVKFKCLVNDKHKEVVAHLTMTLLITLRPMTHGAESGRSVAFPTTSLQNPTTRTMCN